MQVNNEMMDAGVDLLPGIEIQFLYVEHQLLRVGIKRGLSGAPLLIFNGIGASMELLHPVLPMLGDKEVIIFDIPGTGDSPAPLMPYRMSSMARLASKLLVKLNYQDPVDVLGISWGGALAQEFVLQHPHQCRKLILAATMFGAGMVPGHYSAISKMLNPARYEDPEYMVKHAGTLYGGALRKNPELITQYDVGAKVPSIRGYFYQLLAILGWSSLPWLSQIKQHTLIMAGMDDPIIQPLNAHVMAKMIPNSELQLIDDGHMFLLTDVQRHAQTIHAFLESTIFP